ncbi:MAG: beta-propeller domain-containing protein [Thermoproteota archaeon]
MKENGSMGRIVMVFLSLSLIASVFLAAFIVNSKGNVSRLRSFNSYEEIESFVKTKIGEEYLRKCWFYFMPDAQFDLAKPSLAMLKGTPSAMLGEYSTTNIQVYGVDEADIIKTDGRYLYTVSENSVSIVEAYPPENMKIVSRIEVSGYLIGLFINTNRLIILKHENPPLEEDDSSYYWPWGTMLEVYDVSNISSPTLIRRIFIDGNYVSSRMIGNYVYIVTTKPFIMIREQDFEIPIPKIVDDNVTSSIPPEKIFCSNDVENPVSYTIITAVDLYAEEEGLECRAVLTGYSTNMYVSLNNIYVVMPKGIWIWSSEESTEIHRIRINGLQIEFEASGKVPGRILNQFSMDEYEGYFRIATTTGHVARFLSEASSANHVYVLDSETLEIVGRLEDLAPGEEIYSARFMGSRCYLVTFKKVDPLFTIDLSNPAEPKVLGKLKIPGYSDYLHPYDENHFIGIGKETVEAEEGDFAWYQGLKISLFDVSDVSSPREVGKIIIGDRGTDSPVLRDHHAFLFDRRRSLLVIPILEAKIFREKYSGGIPPNTYGEYVFQGAYVFNISPDEGISLRGRITHLENSEDLEKSGYYFTSEYEVVRSLYIGDVLYTVSNGKIKANSITDLSEIAEIKLS